MTPRTPAGLWLHRAWLIVAVPILLPPIMLAAFAGFVVFGAMDAIAENFPPLWADVRETIRLGWRGE